MFRLHLLQVLEALTYSAFFSLPLLFYCVVSLVLPCYVLSIKILLQNPHPKLLHSYYSSCTKTLWSEFHFE